ncbi:hypothetical protein PV08_03664 [Exophiala spinifera]|uniref:Xylanolytic transcriptional activator regulatory domain-containing protein n=1 Tax=Exophiala spinifera TaxID=91928 RepID=A0A0D2C723_9EURO|nr:uncharacterized protein PV08_03664 [Exophiala spinifera]KIW19369.1 hypothetical protein PV08_03664 [Exophiala spinifera]
MQVRAMTWTETNASVSASLADLVVGENCGAMRHSRAVPVKLPKLIASIFRRQELRQLLSLHPLATAQNSSSNASINIAAIIDPLQAIDENVSVLFPEALPEHHEVASDQSILAPDLRSDDFCPLQDNDPRGVDDVWHNSEFWFDQSELDWSGQLFEEHMPILDYEMPSQLTNLTAIMQEYFERKSRPSSPSPVKVKKVCYSAPAHIDNHNTDIIRVFHNVFRRHIPKTFSLFEDTTGISPKKQPAFLLALAATGGLFCTTPGSAQVARSMYDDARRMVLSTVSIRNRPDELSLCREDKLTVVKTFVLLALYDLCSGDKRSYEFLEVFHGNLIHSVQEYSKACQSSTHTDDVDKNNASLLEALHILDCYRVVIMQRPPSLARKYSETFIRTPTNRSRISKLHNIIAGLVSGGHTVDLGRNTTFGLTSLAFLSSFVWPATYPQQNAYDTDNTVPNDLFIWRADFAELACDTWLRTVYNQGNLSHLVLYHLMGIILNSNFTVLQNFAHSSPRSATRDATKGLAGKEINAWTKDRHYATAQWHAENMIASIEATLTDTARQSQHSSTRPTSLPTELPSLAFEAPHVPYAVYYASLVLWAGAFTALNTATSAISGRAQLARGERILLTHKMHIAQLLARLLSGIP